MTIETIPEKLWPDVCRGFAERHRGWLVQLSVIRNSASNCAAPADGTETRVENLPLRDIGVEWHGGQPMFRIVVGRR